MRVFELLQGDAGTHGVEFYLGDELLLNAVIFFNRGANNLQLIVTAFTCYAVNLCDFIIIADNGRKFFDPCGTMAADCD